MDFNIFCQLNDIVKKYTESFIFGNNPKNLNLMLIADLKEEDKENILNEFDLIIPQGIIFSHEYVDGKLKIDFKEVQ